MVYVQRDIEAHTSDEAAAVQHSTQNMSPNDDEAGKVNPDKQTAVAAVVSKFRKKSSSKTTPVT